MMRRFSTLRIVVGVLVALILPVTLMSCDGTGPDPKQKDRCTDPTATNTGEVAECQYPEPDPEMVTKTVEVRESETDTLITTATLTLNGEMLDDDGTAQLKREQGASDVTVKATAPGFQDGDVTVSFDENGTVALMLKAQPPPEPETVTVTVGATLDTDVIVGPDVYEVEITSADGSIERSKPLRELLSR